MIETTIKMTVPAEKRKEVLQTIKAILGPIRRARGCISCNCYVDVEDEGIVFFKEEWMTREDLDNHLRSDRFAVLIQSGHHGNPREPVAGKLAKDLGLHDDSISLTDWVCSS